MCSNAFQIGGTAWPGADTHERVSPGGWRDLGALEQLQFQSILTAVAVSGQARLQWTESGNAPGAITAHEVQYRPKGSSTWLNGPAAAGADTGVDVLGLTNGRTYQFRVRAVAGSSGPGPWSNVAEAIPPVPRSRASTTPPAPASSGADRPVARAAQWARGPRALGCAVLAPRPHDLALHRDHHRYGGRTRHVHGDRDGDRLARAQATTTAVIVIVSAQTPIPALVSYADMVGTAGITIDTGYAHASGLPSDATYSATKLPSGLRIDPKTGAITGTPARAGTYYPLVNATGGGKTTSANRFVISVLEPAVPAHVSYPLIRGRVGWPIGDVFPQLAGIVHTTTFAPSTMPAGLTVLPSTGVIRGTPRKAGTMTVVMTVYHGFDALQTVLTISITTAANGRHISYPARPRAAGPAHRPGPPAHDRRHRPDPLPGHRPATRAAHQHTDRRHHRPRSTGRRKHSEVTVTGTNGSASTKLRIQVTRDPTYHPPRPRPHPHREDSPRRTSTPPPV